MEEQELFELKERIDKAKSKVSELKGRQQYLMGELTKQYNCKTIEAAETKAQKIEDEIVQLNQKITEGTKELEEKYNV